MKKKQPVKNQIIMHIADNPGQYVSKIAKDMDVTYSHIVKEIKRLEEKGYLTSEKIGRQRIVSATKEGLDMAPHCQKVAEL